MQTRGWISTDSHVVEPAEVWSDLRPGGHDPIARLADQNLDVVRVEVLYPTIALTVHRRAIDPSANLLLRQIGKVGVFDHSDGPSSPEALAAVVEKLLEHHPADHEVVLYEAAVTPNCPPHVVRVALRDLPGVRLGPGHTLFVPPSSRSQPDESYQQFRQ